ncbi:MAG: glycine cleavage system protein GcvH [Deltaproteobacteria bacterium]|nr:glycine cleavage system protein GcvH [Deltaproteobacteria bacterium]
MEIKGYNFPEDLYYDADHYWVKIQGQELVMGMNDFAQKLAGQIVYVQLPSDGKKLTKGKKLASVESGKWVGKIMAPVTGSIVTSNQALETKPSLINDDCYGAGWLYKIKPDNINDINDLIHGKEAIEKWALAEMDKHANK